MHTITINVTFLQNSNTAFNDFEDEFVNRNKDSQKGNIFWGVGSVLGGKVGARQTNIF